VRAQYFNSAFNKWMFYLFSRVEQYPSKFALSIEQHNRFSYKFLQIQPHPLNKSSTFFFNHGIITAISAVL